MEEQDIHHGDTETRSNKEKLVSLLSSLRASVSPWFTSLPERAEALAVRAGALKEAVANHIDVWKEALAADKARPKQDPFGKAELAFLPAALEVTETPVSPAARMTAITIAAFFTITVAWASIGELDIVATASGKIIPSERVKVIQPLETSIVRAVNVAEGQEVKAGDTLVELEVTGAQADVDRLFSESDTARADAARLEALLTAAPMAAYAPPTDLPDHLRELHRSLLLSQLREHQSKLAALEADLAKRQAELKTVDSEIARLKDVEIKVKDETERRQEAAAKGFGSQIARITAEKELAENLGQQSVQRARLVEARATIDSLKSQVTQAREEFRRDNTLKLAEARTKAASLQQDLNKASDRQRVLTLKAPVDGIAQQIDVHTIGGVVTPAQKLLVVVPKGAILEIEAKLPNKDIGFVEPGQVAEVKVDAFPFTKYGTLIGKVETVSLDAIEDEKTKEFQFPIRLSLAQSAIAIDNGKRIPLSPGMTVTAEVKTGTRKPIEYILAPLQKYGDETARER